MPCITAVLGPHEYGLRIWLGAQGGRQISTGREDFAGGSAVLPKLSEGLEIELSDCEAENATLKGDWLLQVVEIVIGGVPTVVEVRFMCLIKSLGRILLQGSVLTNLLDPMRHQVDLRKVEIGIQLLGNIYLVADIIPPGVHSAPLLAPRPSFSICFLVYLSLLHEFRSQGIGFSLRLFRRLARVRKHLWRCANDASRPPCSSKLHHREIYIEHTYRILTMPVCTQLLDWIRDAVRGFRLVETGLQL